MGCGSNIAGRRQRYTAGTHPAEEDKLNFVIYIGRLWRMRYREQSAGVVGEGGMEWGEMQALGRGGRLVKVGGRVTKEDKGGGGQ